MLNTGSKNYNQGNEPAFWKGPSSFLVENGLEGDESEAEGFRGHSRTQGRALGGLHQAEVEMERRGGLEVSGRGNIVSIVYKGEGGVKGEVQSGAGAEWGAFAEEGAQGETQIMGS